MTLSLAGQTLSDASGLSEAARLSLTFIDGGEPWLRWAIVQPRAAYAFADEAALLEGVQSGLHGSPLILLPVLGLWIGPTRLLSLGAASLRTLAKAEAGGKPTPAVGKVLTESNLLTASDLAAGAAWLTDQGVADAPLFQAPSLADRIALARAAGDETADPAVAKAASAFALAEARTPAEFIDYRRLYLAIAGRLPTDAPARQLAQVQQCIHVLLPWMFIALDCPSLPPPVTAEAAGEALGSWFASGRLLGFASAAAGARQICERTDFTPEAADVGGLITGYLHQAAAALQAGPLTLTLNQDGQSAVLRGGPGEVGSNAVGVLSLDDFNPALENS